MCIRASPDPLAVPRRGRGAARRAARGGEGPAAIFVPSGVVHGFRFAPDSDGFVLTLSPRFAMEGEPEFAGEAFARIFASADVLRLRADDPAVPRADALFRELAAEFALPGERVSPATLWLARALIWRLARARAESGEGEGQARIAPRRSMGASCNSSNSIFSTAGRSTATPRGSAFRPSGSTAWRAPKAAARRWRSCMIG